MAGFSQGRGVFVSSISSPVMINAAGPFGSTYIGETRPGPTGNGATVRACSVCCMTVSSAINMSDGLKGFAYLTLTFKLANEVI